MKAEHMLQRTEDYFQRKQGRTPIGAAVKNLIFETMREQTELSPVLH